MDKLRPQTKLTDIFERQTRRKDIRAIENQLEIKLQALRPRHFISYSLLVVFLVSLIGLFFNWRYGLAGLGLSIIGNRVADKIGIEFKDKTLGELTSRMTQLNYVKSRRQPGTMNKQEIQLKIRKLFVDSFRLEDKDLDRDTVIV